MTPGPTVAGLQDPGRKLLQLGVLLFLMGLLTGLTIPIFVVPRLGLSSHLASTMGGLFLMALGLIWPRLSLGSGLATTTFVAAVYGNFANWLATFLGAMWGAGGQMMPIAGGGRIATPLAEAIVAGLLISLSLAMVFVCLSVLWGLRDTRT